LTLESFDTPVPGSVSSAERLTRITATYGSLIHEQVELTRRFLGQTDPDLAMGDGPLVEEAIRLVLRGAEWLELKELIEVKRPEVIARIRTAKELGDLKENADYHAAREEQSFLEGRIQALEARLRDAVIIEAPAAGEGANLGSRVVVESDGLEAEYTLVGSAEADPKAGRLSVVSPVGKALVGARAGDEVAVETPRGQAMYRVLKVE